MSEEQAPPAPKPWWKKNLAVPLMVAVMVARIYSRFSSTASETLAAGERPRHEDVLIASAPHSSEALVKVLEAGAGAQSLPSLELGATRRSMATAAYDAVLPAWFWLNKATVGLATMHATPPQPRLFVSWQPLNETFVGPSNLTASFDCGTDMGPYACLCPNCPARWRTIVYVVESRTVAGCRDYGVSWGQHVLSYLRAADANVVVYEKGGYRTVADGNSKRILVVADDDVRARPGPTAAAVWAWIFDTVYDDADIDRRLVQVDHDTIKRQVRATFDTQLRPSTASDCASRLPAHDDAAASDAAALLGGA